MTAHEETLLPAPLAAAIDLDEVRVIARWHTPLARMLKVTIVRGSRIFWENAQEEARTIGECAHLSHELVHVWQYEALRRTGVELLLSRVYRYRLDPSRHFLSYGYEQQAAIVEDFTRMKAGATSRWAVAPFAALVDYERVIETAARI
ncbi:MAG: hypothetical protein ACOZAA_04485 [Pseudomonadota bacterium]